MAATAEGEEPADFENDDYGVGGGFTTRQRAQRQRLMWQRLDKGPNGFVATTEASVEGGGTQGFENDNCSFNGRRLFRGKQRRRRRNDRPTTGALAQEEGLEELDTTMEASEEYKDK